MPYYIKDPNRDPNFDNHPCGQAYRNPTRDAEIMLLGLPPVEAQKLETQWPQSLRVMFRESQHDLALIWLPTSWGLLYSLGFRVQEFALGIGSSMSIFNEPPSFLQPSRVLRGELLKLPSP